MDRALDRVAAGLSTLCVMHCLAGSALLLFYAPLSGFMAHEVHVWGLAVAAPLALYALVRGARVHRRARPLRIGVGGLVLMTLGLLVGHGGAAEFVLTALGAGALGTAHLMNLRGCAEIARTR